MRGGVAPRTDLRQAENLFIRDRLTDVRIFGLELDTRLGLDRDDLRDLSGKAARIKEKLS